MNLRNFYSTLLLVCAIAAPKQIDAQERTPWKGATYKFESKQEVLGDSSSTTYCVMSLEELRKFNKIILSYNEKTKKFATKNLLTEKSADYKIESNLIYFKIEETLIEPFVILTGEDKDGKTFTIRERNALGNIIDPVQEKTKWKKSIARIDSMDYVRKFDNVYVGKDGKPRFKDKNGKIQVIEKSSIHLEN
jgi:hypothetical protein